MRRQSGTGLYRHSSGFFYWRRVHPKTGRRCVRSTGFTRRDLALRKGAEWDEELEREAAGLKSYSSWKVELEPLARRWIAWQESHGGIGVVSLENKRMRILRALETLRLVRAADLDDVAMLDERVRALPVTQQQQRRAFQEPLRQFSAWLAGNGRVLERDPLERWEPIAFTSGDVKERRALDPAELARALVALSWLGVRHKHLHSQELLFRCLFVTGARVNALLSRNVQHLLSDESRLDMGDAVGNKLKGRGALDARTLDELRRRTSGRQAGEPLLLGPQGTRQDQFRARDLWRQALSLAFVDELWPTDAPRDLDLGALVSRSLLRGSVHVSEGGNPKLLGEKTKKRIDELTVTVAALVSRIEPTWRGRMAGLDVHALRMTHHTWARALGVPPPCIDAQLGHSPGSGEHHLDVMRAVLAGSRTGARHYLDMDSKMLDAGRSARAVAERLDEALAALATDAKSLLGCWSATRATQVAS